MAIKIEKIEVPENEDTSLHPAIFAPIKRELEESAACTFGMLIEAETGRIVAMTNAPDAPHVLAALAREHGEDDFIVMKCTAFTAPNERNIGPMVTKLADELRRDIEKAFAKKESKAKASDGDADMLAKLFAAFGKN